MAHCEDTFFTLSNLNTKGKKIINTQVQELGSWAPGSQVPVSGS